MFTFDLLAVYLLSAICERQQKQCNYYIDQSEPLNSCWTDFTSSVGNFYHSGADIPPGKAVYL